MFRGSIVALVALAAPCAAVAETLDNTSVVAMTKAGLGDEVIIAKIKSSANKFDLSTEQMIALKQSGLSSAVIASMITSSEGSPVSAHAAFSADSPDPSVPHPAGVYLLASWLPQPKMVKIDPTTANQTKTGGILGYAMTGGLASLSMKSVIPGGAARIAAGSKTPTFYFYFDQANQSLSNGGNASSWSWNAGSVTSPNEFSLVRFDTKSNRREARVGSFNIAGAKTGVMDKDRITFKYDQVAPGVYAVSPSAPLAAGQYAFLYSITAGGGSSMFGGGTSAMTARVFDFGIE